MPVAKALYKATPLSAKAVTRPGFDVQLIRITMHWNDEPRPSPLVGLDCGELLNTLDFVTLSYVHGARDSPRISSEFSEGTGVVNSIDSPRGRHWLWLCGSPEGPSSWVPARIQLRQDGFIVPVLARENLDAGVHFPKELCVGGTDLGYPEIGDVFAQLGHAPEVAQEMLERVKGNFSKSFKAYDGFIDAVIVLMFGVEAGKKLSTCATSLMMLELIAAEHPCASHGNTLLTLASAFRKGAGKPSIAAIHRDLHIVRHWLDLTESLDGYNQLSVKGRILKLLRTHLG